LITSRSTGGRRRLFQACLLVLGLLIAAPGCGMFMRSPDSGYSNWPPRPLKRMREIRRERELQDELANEKFPRAEQVGIRPASASEEPLTR
jgi:hypothetical protein